MRQLPHGYLIILALKVFLHLLPLEKYVVAPMVAQESTVRERLRDPSAQSQDTRY
jgi:hypothetical protein